MTCARTLLLALFASASAAAVQAQEAAPSPAPAAQAAPYDPDAPESDDTVLSEVVVSAARQPGAVVGDIKPEIQLSPDDIRAYGAADLTQLLDALAPQIQSDRGRGGGRPVVLLNGKRISSFREIRSIPSEAILRVDILPEEVALKYGYRADQRVVNVVLRPRFRAATVEAEGSAPTAGGQGSSELDVDLLDIHDDGRFSLEVERTASSALLESERDIALTGLPDERPFRTLVPETEQTSLTGTYNRMVFGKVSATLNAGYDQTATDSLFGLADDAARALGREVNGQSGHLGLTFNGDINPEWRWSLIANYDRSETETFTDNADTLARDRALVTDQTAGAEAVLNGALFQLPAGAVSTTFMGGVESHTFNSRTANVGLSPILADLERDTVTGRVNLDVPIVRRGRFGPDWLGDLSATGNVEIQQLSDFGALKIVNLGANWSPIDQLELIASVTDEEGPPTLNQLGDPLLESPNTPVFDFATGQTALVTLVGGGNPALGADHRKVFKLGANLKPLKSADLTLSANYIRTTIDDPISAFPTGDPAIEAAFPDRFTRDTAGNLIAIDARPINFARSETAEIRWGLNFSKTLKAPPREGREQGAPGAPGGPPSGVRPPGEGPRRDGAGPGSGPGGPGGFRGFGGGGRFGGGRDGRVQFSIYHTWHLEDRILVQDGGPLLDLLDGSSAGSLGGQPRHEIEAEAGVFKNGLGARVDAKWQSATFVRGDTAAGDLDFSDLTTVNLRLFANLGQQRWARGDPWLRGSRLSLDVDNLFDARVQVTDASGLTPIAYQPDLLDPLGRTIKLSFRKLIF